MTELDRPTALEPGGPNAIGRMLGLLGDEWTLLIIQQVLQGVSRYGQFMSAIPISNAVLTGRLRVLTREGMLNRHVYQTNPMRAEYLPTARTRSLWRMMLAIWQWERSWVPEHAHTLPVMHHAACDRDFDPLLTCRACGKVTEAKDVSATWGPSGSWERSAPIAVTRRRSEPDSINSADRTGAGLFPETMLMFGNRWSSAMLGAAFRGVTRFSDFEVALGAPPNVVSERLRAFTSIGVLASSQNEKRPDWAEYHLTEKGRSFFPVVAAALTWAERWFVAPEGPALNETHRACGEPFVAVFACDQCQQPLTAPEVQVVPT